jgi:hypothetical protein
MKFEYFNGRELASNSYFMIPKALIKDPVLRKLSPVAKLLYGMMLDKMRWAAKKNQMDTEGRVFIYYSWEKIHEELDIGRNQIYKVIDELDAENGIGLIERVKLGQGKTSRIYVMRIVEAEHDDEESCEDDQKFEKEDSEENYKFSESPNLNFKNHQNRDSRVPNSSTPEVYDQGRINKNINNKNSSNNLISIYPAKKTKEQQDGMRLDLDEKAYRLIVREDIGTDSLCEMYPAEEERIRGLEDLIVDVLTSIRPKIVIGGNERGIGSVKGRFLKLTRFHLETVLGNLNKLTEEPSNLRQYILAMLYNASGTSDAQLQIKVNHDLAYGFGVTGKDEEFMEG